MMYTTAINPWQSSGFAPQQYFSAQSFLPYQAQAYNLPVQTGTVPLPSWGYTLPSSNVMAPPAGNMPTSFIPQGTISFGFNPSWGWHQVNNPMLGGQYAQMQHQIQPNLTTGIRAISGFAQPRVELAETNNDVIVTADLPNVDPNNIYITVTDDSLSISALAHLGGISSSLHRTVALPTSVRSEHLDVSYTNGTLECRLPKSDFTARRRVKVNATT